jgi:competence protein ComEA
MSDPQRPPYWLLSRTDQTAVAALIAATLLATVGWWLAHGGWRGETIELEQAKPLGYQFQVDINAADVQELNQLPGVGPVLARRIIDSRESKGPFAAIDDLRRVPGIGPKTLKRIRPYLRPIIVGSSGKH